MASNCPEKGGSALEEHELDYWVFDRDRVAWKRVHVKPRKRLYTPVGRSCPFNSTELVPARETQWKCKGRVSNFSDSWHDKSPNRRISSKSWVGETWFFPKGEIDIAQAELDTLKANAAEQLKRSPVKGGAAVASILQSLETECPEAKAMVAETSKVVKKESEGTSARNHKLRLPGQEVMFEFCCDENSTLGQICDEYEIDHFRLTEKNSDASHPKQIDSLKKLVTLFPGCDLWGSIPHGPWSHCPGLSRNKIGPLEKERLRKQRACSRKILRNFIAVGEIVLNQGGHVSFEWPHDCCGWALPELASFIKRHNLYGASHGTVDKDDVPNLQRLRVVTSSWKLAENLSAKRCHSLSGSTRSNTEGSQKSSTALYPKPMAYTIIHSLYPRVSAECPSMPVVPFVQHAHSSRDKGESVYAAIHQPIDRKDWHKHAGAQECIKGEAQGLISNGTWDYTNVVPRKDLLARKEPLNIGRLMTLLSIKHFEVPELRKLKARIVFRGDDIRDESDNLAILQELKVNPTGLIGINFNLAYGSVKGHQTTQSDVVKAYTQSDLNTRVPTWVELPRELTPPECRHLERPCVRLWKSLYGHPESGYHWHERFSTIMKAMGGEHSDLFQSTWFFKADVNTLRR